MKTNINTIILIAFIILFLTISAFILYASTYTIPAFNQTMMP